MNDRLRNNLIRGTTGWLFMTPGAAIITVCVLVPTGLALLLSFTQCSRFLSAHWVGLHNYRLLLTDPLTLKAFANTLTYLLAFVPLNLACSLAVALLLNRRFPGIKIIRSVYFVPVAVSGIVAVSVFRFLLDKDHGPVNALLATCGFDPVAWLADPRWSMPAIVVITLWKSTAFFSLILLAALQDVPASLYEAAAVDGAGKGRRFFHITLPSIMPVLMIVVTLSSIGAFRVFEPMFVLTRGGPADSTVTLALHAYNAALNQGEIGYANAVSFLLLALVLAATLLLNRIARRFE